MERGIEYKAQSFNPCTINLLGDDRQQMFWRTTMEIEQETAPKKTSWLGICAILAAIGASLCCVAPLLLLSLGIGGAWMSTLTSMQAVRPLFFILSLIFIGLGYRKTLLGFHNTVLKAKCVHCPITWKDNGQPSGWAQHLFFCCWHSLGMHLILCKGD